MLIHIAYPRWLLWFRLRILLDFYPLIHIRTISSTIPTFLSPFLYPYFVGFSTLIHILFNDTFCGYMPIIDSFYSSLMFCTISKFDFIFITVFKTLTISAISFFSKSPMSHRPLLFTSSIILIM